MKHELIDRYIYAVTRGLPAASRAEVEKELAALISDMLDQRCDGADPADADVRAVLTDLGDPDEMAAKYNGDERGALISGRHFIIYKRLLRIVLPIGAVVIAFATIMSYIEGWAAQAPVPGAVASAIGEVVAAAVGGAIQAFALITIVFAVLEHRTSGAKQRDFLATLPPVPRPGERIRPAGPIVSMMLWIVLTIVFLGFPQIIGAYVTGVGWVPVFAVAVLRSLWLPILAWAVLSIAKDTFRLVEGAQTVRVAVVTLVANVLIVACAALVFLHSGIMNPDFLAHLGDYMSVHGTPVTVVGGNTVNLIVFATIALAVAVETVVTGIKALVSRI